MTGTRFENGIWAEQTGEGSDVLLLIHGLGANGATWDMFRAHIEGAWPGRVLVPDLRGHGRSEHRGNYAFGTMAADLAELVRPGDRVTIVGHSLGGALGALLGSGWFGIDVDLVVALSVKVNWTVGEIEKGRSLAGNPVRLMATQEEATERYLRVSGLSNHQAQVARSAAAGVAQEAGQFRVAADPRIFGCAAPGVPDLLAQARCPLILATGEQDPIAPSADFATAGLPVTVIPGAGHQVHLDAPAAIWRLMSPIARHSGAVAMPA